MTTYNVYLYNFSGATTPSISIQWGNDDTPAETSYPTAPYPVSTDITPSIIANIPTGFDTYILMYDNDGNVATASTDGTGFPIIFNRLGIAYVYILNDPNATLPGGLATDYYSNGTGVDTAYIINGTQYQFANTYNFPNPSPYLAFAVPAVSASGMQQLTAAPNVFANDPASPPGAVRKPLSFTPSGKVKDAVETYQKNQTATDSTNYWYWAAIAIIVLIVLLLIGGGTYYLIKKKNK